MRGKGAGVYKVFFELTNACNFRCEFCPIDGSTRVTQHMDFDLYRKGIDDLVRDNVAKVVGFHILGEPLLYPRLGEAITLAKSRGLRTELVTNGSLLSPEKVDVLLNAGLDHLAISLETIDEGEHACRHARLPFAEYYRRVLEAVRRITASDSGPTIELCLMNPATRKYFTLDDPQRMNWGASDFRKKLATFLLDLGETVGHSLTAEGVERALRRVPLTRPGLVRLGERLTVFVQPFGDWGNAFTKRRVYPARRGYCGYALSSVGVLCTGEVTICCVDYDGKTSLGNLREAALAQLLASPRARAIADGFQRLRVEDPHCQRCLGGPTPAGAFFKSLASIYLFKWFDFKPARAREVSLIS